MSLVGLGNQRLVSCGAEKERKLALICAQPDIAILTSPSAPRLPNVIPLLPCRPLGGLPPLAMGCGIGEGDCAGEVTLGLLGIAIGADV